VISNKRYVEEKGREIKTVSDIGKRELVQERDRLEKERKREFGEE